MNALTHPSGLRPAEARLGIRPSSVVSVVLVLMLAWHFGPVGPLVPPSYSSHGAGVEELADENQVLRLSWLPIYAITLLLAGRHLPAMCRIALRSTLLLMLLALAIVSTLWSVAPEDTLRRIAAVSCTTVLGLYIALRFRPREIIRLFGWALVVLILASLVAIVVSPAIGISGEPHPGAWRGVFVNKNSLGQAMLMAVVTFLVIAGMGRKRFWPYLGTAVAAALLATSTAKTPVVVACGLVLIAILVWMARRNPSRSAYVAAITVAGAIVAPIILFVILEPTLSLLGRDLTLTGRTQIWALAWEKIQQRPILGYGYGAFWSLTGTEILDIRYVTGWMVPNAHNGYLDLMLNFGVLGAVLFVLMVVRTISLALRTGTQTDPWSALWAVLMLTMFVIYGFAESQFMEQNTVNWLCFVILYANRGHPAMAGAAARGRMPPTVAARASPERILR